MEVENYFYDAIVFTVRKYDIRIAPSYAPVFEEKIDGPVHSAINKLVYSINRTK